MNGRRFGRSRPPLVLVEAPRERRTAQQRADDAFALWAGVALFLGVALICAAITVGLVWPA